MPLQNYQYDTIMREYNRRQAQNRRIQEEHQAEAYEKIPRLREIDEEVATLSARKVHALINRQESGIDDLRNDYRDKQIKHNFQKFEERGKNAFFPVIFQIDCERSHF